MRVAEFWFLSYVKFFARIWLIVKSVELTLDLKYPLLSVHDPLLDVLHPAALPGPNFPRTVAPATGSPLADLTRTFTKANQCILLRLTYLAEAVIEPTETNCPAGES